MEKIIVSTTNGKICGWKKDDGCEFLGVPYAKAKRFQAPLPECWEGVKSCLEYGTAAPQANYLGIRPAATTFALQGEEEHCLNLNVWTRSLDEQAGLPVVIYVHGGAFQVGRNSAAGRDGFTFMEQDDMVFVSVNLRLGVLGFLALGEEAPEAYRNAGNNGMKDLYMAVKWVYENAKGFGGDPKNITLFGISAGAKAIGSLLANPLVQQMCSKIVLESGAMQAFRTREAALDIGRKFLDFLPEGKKPWEMPLDELIRAQADFCGVEGTTCYFGPVLDGELFAEDWLEKWEHGQRWRGNALIGSGRRELSGTAYKDAFLEEADAVLERLFGSNKIFAWEKYLELKNGGMEEKECWTQVLSDFMYRFYSDDLAKRLCREGNPVWVYSFEYMPARHGMGFHFLMNQWHFPQFGVTDDRREEAEKLAAYMRTCLRRFIVTGDPEGCDGEWPRYEGENKMIFAAAPHMEKRVKDTLEGLPGMVYQI